MKLSNWLTARWNRRVIELEEESQPFRRFCDLVKFVPRGAKIACNPVTSFHSLKSSVGETEKTPNNQSIGARALANNSEENPD